MVSSGFHNSGKIELHSQQCGADGQCKRGKQLSEIELRRWQCRVVRLREKEAIYNSMISIVILWILTLTVVELPAALVPLV